MSDDNRKFFDNYAADAGSGAVDRARTEGAKAERARIVAWLFHRAAMRDPSHPKESLVASTLYEALAKQIQAGAHEEDHCGNATERGEHEDK